MQDPLTLLWLALAVGGALAWWRAAIEARERANAAAREACEACERAGAQLLDGTVAFRSLRPARDAAGRVALRRTYVFDYSEDGTTRRQGFVIVRGGELEFVGLGPTLVRERTS